MQWWRYAAAYCTHGWRSAAGQDTPHQPCARLCGFNQGFTWRRNHMWDRRIFAAYRAIDGWRVTPRIHVGITCSGLVRIGGGCPIVARPAIGSWLVGLDKPRNGWMINTFAIGSWPF